MRLFHDISVTSVTDSGAARNFHLGGYNPEGLGDRSPPVGVG